MLRLATALLLLLPEVVLPRPAELAAAMSDHVELERLSTRLGPARLLRLLESTAAPKKARVTLAVLHGMGLMGEAHPELGLQLIGPLAETLQHFAPAKQLDDKQLEAAALALSRTARALGRHAACAPAVLSKEVENDEPTDCGPALHEAAERLYELGANQTLPQSLREGAFSALAALPLASWEQLIPRLVKLAETTHSPPAAPPEHGAPGPLRVLGALVPRDRAEPLLALLRNAEPTLASAAAGEYCAVLAPRKGPTATPMLPEDLIPRLRALSAPEQPLSQRMHLVECLRFLGSPADRTLLQAIQNDVRKKGKASHH